MEGGPLDLDKLATNGDRNRMASTEFIKTVAGLTPGTIEQVRAEIEAGATKPRDLVIAALGTVFKRLTDAGFTRADVDGFMNSQGKTGRLAEIQQALDDLGILCDLLPKAPTPSP